MRVKVVGQFNEMFNLRIGVGPLALEEETAVVTLDEPFHPAPGAERMAHTVKNPEFFVLAIT